MGFLSKAFKAVTKPVKKVAKKVEKVVKPAIKDPVGFAKKAAITLSPAKIADVAIKSNSFTRGIYEDIDQASGGKLEMISRAQGGDLEAIKGVGTMVAASQTGGLLGGGGGLAAGLANNGGGGMNFLETINGFLGSDLGKIVGNGLGLTNGPGGSQQPASVIVQQPAPTPTTAPSTGMDSKTMMMIGGGAAVFMLLIVLLTRKS